jgi:hypothetical protein
VRKLEIQGICITVEDKKIQRMYLRVYPPDGQVKMTVPRYTSLEAVRAFAESRMDWILKNREKYRAQAQMTAPHCESGDQICLFGTLYLLTLQPSAGRTGAIAAENNEILLFCAPNATEAQRMAAMEQFYRARLREEIGARLEKWEKTIGVSASSYYLRAMNTRWGTCNTQTGRICLNLRLVHYPVRCLDYVMVHELCHLLVPNHSRRFYEVLGRYLPDWKELRARLNASPVEAPVEAPDN